MGVLYHKNDANNKKGPGGPFLKLNILKNITTDKPRNSAYLSIARIAEQR